MPAALSTTDEIVARLSAIEATLQSLSVAVPAGLLQDVAAIKARIASIEQQEDPLEPVVPPYVGFSGYVYLSAKLFDLTSSTPLKWIVVDWANGTVSYSNTDPSDPFPPGTEYYRTDRVHGDLHVTRIG